MVQTLYRLFRYLYVIYQKELTKSPEYEIILDRPLLINSGLYLAAAALAIYLS